MYLSRLYIATLALAVVSGAFVSAQATRVQTEASAGASAVDGLSILVLGDSYSAGQGAGRYTGPPRCNRSRRNYGQHFKRLVEARHPGRTVTVVTKACSEASTADYFATDPDTGQVPQATWVNTRYDVLMLTLGAEDLGFPRIFRRCLAEATDSARACRARLLDARRTVRSGATKRRLERVLAHISRQAAPHARVVLLGYPRLEGSADLRLGAINVGKRLRVIQSQFEARQRDLIARLNQDSQFGRRPFRFVSTARMFAGRSAWLPRQERVRHELFKGRLNRHRWLVDPARDVRPSTADSGGHPNPKGWLREAHLLVHSRGVPESSRPDPAGIEGAAWLYEARSGFQFPSDTGIRRSVDQGDLQSDNSTSIWVGCEGQRTIANFGLNRRYADFQTLLTLDEGTPAGLVVDVTVDLDGQGTASWLLRPGDRVPIQVSVSEKDVLTVGALAANPSECAPSSVGYGILFDALLTPAPS
jgi:hypothetical protein